MKPQAKQLKEINEKLRILSLNYWELKEQILKIDQVIRDLRISLIKYQDNPLL